MASLPKEDRRQITRQVKPHDSFLSTGPVSTFIPGASRCFDFRVNLKQLRSLRRDAAGLLICSCATFLRRETINGTQ